MGDVNGQRKDTRKSHVYPEPAPYHPSREIHKVTMKNDALMYETIHEIALRHDLGDSAAQIHGILTGLLCIQGSVSLTRWLDIILEGTPDQMATGSLERLRVLHQTTCCQINEPDFSFRLFLPEEDTLQEQAKALGDWCSGFLYGVGYHSRQGSVWPGDTEEILNDFLQICRITCSPLDEENDLMELTEYVRICTQVIRMEFMQWRQSRRVH